MHCMWQSHNTSYCELLQKEGPRADRGGADNAAQEGQGGAGARRAAARGRAPPQEPRRRHHTESLETVGTHRQLKHNLSLRFNLGVEMCVRYFCNGKATLFM